MMNDLGASAGDRRQDCFLDPKQVPSHVRPVTGRCLQRAISRGVGRAPLASQTAEAPAERTSLVLLHDVCFTGLWEDGITFAVLDLCDDDQRSHLTLVTSEAFGDIDFLEILKGTQLSCLNTSAGMIVLPLAQQNGQVLCHLFNQLIGRYHLTMEEGMDTTDATDQLHKFMDQLIASRWQSR